MWFVIVLSLSIALASLVIVTAVVILVCFRFCPARCRHRSSQHQQQQPASRRSSLCVELPPPYPGPFIPGQLASGVASPTGAGTTSAWLGHADDAGGEDEACGGVDVDVDKKFPSDDNDEGHFVPDAVEMSAKLAEVIPPPPHLNYDQHHYQRHHERHRHPRPHRHHAQQPQLHGEDCVSFVPDDDARDRSTARRYHGESTGSSGTPGSADWWRKMSTGSSGSSAATSLNASASASSSSTTGGDGGRLSGSSSSRRCSPPSFYVPSTRSSSQSSQSHLVLTDDPDTTQTDIDYY